MTGQGCGDDRCDELKQMYRTIESIDQLYKQCSVCLQLFRKSHNEEVPEGYICDDCKRLNLQHSEVKFVPRYVCPYLEIKTTPLIRHVCSIKTEIGFGLNTKKKGTILCPHWNFTGCPIFKDQKMKEWSEQTENHEEFDLEVDDEDFAKKCQTYSNKIPKSVIEELFKGSIEHNLNELVCPVCSTKLTDCDVEELTEELIDEMEIGRFSTVKCLHCKNSIAINVKSVSFVASKEE